MGAVFRHRCCSWAATLALACAGLFCTTVVDDAAAADAIESATLKNGMELVVIPNHRAPMVSHMIWYRVGGADDLPGKSGLAHYNEHMMFLGTPALKKGEYSRRIARHGGNHNAFTNKDYTAYYANIAREHLPMVMEMEADRMRHLAPPPEEFRREREVIIEERRMRMDNKPESLLSEQMDAALFLNHPYRLSTIGWKHEMETLSQDDVMAFHRRFYHPANAVLVVAGDITLKELQPLTEKYYGSIPAGTKNPRAWSKEPPHRASARLQMRHPNVREPLLMRRYLMSGLVDGDTSRAPALYVWAQWLGGSKTSRFYQALVREKKLATAVSVDYDGLCLGPARLNITARPAAGVTLDTLEREIDALLEQARNAPPSEDELRRAKLAQKASIVFTADGLQGMANLVGEFRMAGLPADFAQHWPETIDTVTAAQVLEAGRKELDITRSVTAWLLPEAQAPAAAKAAVGTETSHAP